MHILRMKLDKKNIFNWGGGGGGGGEGGKGVGTPLNSGDSSWIQGLCRSFFFASLNPVSSKTEYEGGPSLKEKEKINIYRKAK